jgi:hypothetical protein
MLYGLVVENLMKAGLAHRGQGHDNSQNLNLKSHDLIELGRKLEISFSNEETELLERLENFVEGVQEAILRVAQREMYDDPRVAGGPDVLSESAR